MPTTSATRQERKRVANAYAGDDETTGKDPWSRARIQVGQRPAAASLGKCGATTRPKPPRAAS